MRKLVLLVTILAMLASMVGACTAPATPTAVPPTAVQPTKAPVAPTPAGPKSGGALVFATSVTAYQPSTQELLVVRENVDESNLDGLRIIVAHELVHRAQHLNHPELFDQVDDAVRHAFDELSAGKAGLRDLWDGAGHVRAIMTLLESHAYYVQEQLRRTRFVGATVERHFGLAPLLLRALGGFKLSQYTLAVPQVAEATRTGTIDGLYASLSESGNGHVPFAL